MKHINLFALILFAFTLIGCNKEIVSENDAVQTEQDAATDQAGSDPVFTLTATYGEPGTKLSFDSDGLNTTWQPGDKLYIIDPSGTNSIVEMTTDIAEPSKSAKFTSTTSVLPGEYVVVYGKNQLYGNSVDLSLATNEQLSSRIVLTAPLTIQANQTSASIALKHAFAKLTFTFRNVPSDASNMSFGMAAANKGLQTSSDASFTKDGWSAPYSPKLNFAQGSFALSNGSKASVLISPADISGDKAYFYLANSRGKAYEIVKDGINLKAGVNYNITLDFATASIISLSHNSNSGGYELTKPADFRAALYCNLNNLSVVNDIDFQNDTYIPIKRNDGSSVTLKGNSHILNNVTINMTSLDNVGLISQGSASNIVVKNGAVKGKSYVGGIVGSGYATECGFEGDVEASGDYVGGIAGAAMQGINRCYHVGTVTGNIYVGGITGGNSGRRHYSSYNIGTVTGSSNVGGITGGDRSYYCYSYGAVSSGYGICGDYEYGSYCLTSCSKLSKSYSNSEYTNFGPSKTFISSLSIINGQEAYSTQTWTNIDAGCPLLRWQADAFGGDISAPGFGNENW